MSRAVGQRKLSNDIRILKLCMDSKEDRQTYEKVRNDPSCEILDKQYFSTPKGVVWAVLEFTDLQNVATQSPEQVSGGVSNQEE